MIDSCYVRLLAAPQISEGDSKERYERTQAFEDSVRW
jgi:hypothetical protein